MKKKLCLTLYISLSVSCIASDVLCKPLSQGPSSTYEVQCKHNGKTLKGFIRSISKISTLVLENGKPLILKDQLFDLKTKSYIAQSNELTKEKIKYIKIKPENLTLFNDSTLDTPSYGCKWSNHEVHKIKLKNCTLCFGDTLCNFGNGVHTTQSFCKSNNRANFETCPNASNCYASKSVAVKAMPTSPKYLPSREYNENTSSSLSQ